MENPAPSFPWAAGVKGKAVLSCLSPARSGNLRSVGRGTMVRARAEPRPYGLPKTLLSLCHLLPRPCNAESQASASSFLWLIPPNNGFFAFFFFFFSSSSLASLSHLSFAWPDVPSSGVSWSGCSRLWVSEDQGFLRILFISDGHWTGPRQRQRLQEINLRLCCPS